MQGGLHLAPVRRVAATGRRIIGALELDDLAGGILHHLAASDEIGVAQPHLAPGRKTVEFLGRHFHEVVALDIELAAEADAPDARGRILGAVDGIELLARTVRVIFDDHFQRTQHRHATQRRLVEGLTDRVLEHADIDEAVGLRDADPPHEITDRGRRHAAATQPRQCRHARIIPAFDVSLAHQLRQHALGKHRVGEIEAREFILPGPRGNRKVIEKPFVERSMVLEFERAQRVRYALDGVGLAMGKVVARINAPLRARARMAGVEDAVEERIAQVDVTGRHVDLGAEHARSIGKLAGPHAAEEIEVLLDRAVAVGAVLPGLGQRAAARADLVLRLVVHIGEAVANEVLGPFVELLEIVRCVIEMGAPVEAEPAHVLLDGVDVFLRLLGRIGVVEAQVAAAAELLRHAEIEANGLGVADVKIAVGLGRKPRDHPGMALRIKIGLNDVADEIASRFRDQSCAFRHALKPFFAPRFCVAILPCAALEAAAVEAYVPNPRAAAKMPICHRSCARRLRSM